MTRTVPASLRKVAELAHVPDVLVDDMLQIAMTRFRPWAPAFGSESGTAAASTVRPLSERNAILLRFLRRGGSHDHTATRPADLPAHSG